MELEHIDKLCDQFEDRLKADPETSVQSFLQELDLTSNESLARELELVAEDYQRETGSGRATDGRKNPLLEGGRIGPYLLGEQLGEGGMGTVFMARQTEPVKRQVALKVIRQGLDSKEVLARFESERQALAMMDHENIAAMYDAGTSHEGRPYFAMELV
ncbi:MAG: protein kinase, partial [Planctomycetota bacterium]